MDATPCRWTNHLDEAGDHRYQPVDCRPDPHRGERYRGCFAGLIGRLFVEGVDGDPSNVIGISLPLTRRLLAAVGVTVTDLWRS